MTNIQNKPRKPEKTNILIWLEFIPFWMLYKMVRALPLKLAYSIAKFLFTLLYYLDFRHRNRAIQHLLHAGVANNTIEAKTIAKKTFQNFGMLFIEIIKADQCCSMDKIQVKGDSNSIKTLFVDKSKRRNVILVTAHYGNWEIAGPAWAEKTGIPMVSVMRPFENPLIGDYILRNRSSENHELVNKRGGLKGIVKALKKKKTGTFLVDQHAGRKEGGVDTLFFGQPCRTHASPAILHLKTNTPIIPMITKRLDDNFNFEFVLGELIRYKPTGDNTRDIRVIAQIYTTELEKLIEDEPDQWMWAHRRWLNINR